MRIKRIQTIYNCSLLRTPVTILHSRMQNDKCEYLHIYITTKHFRNVNEIRLINIAKVCYCCERATYSDKVYAYPNYTTTVVD